MFSHSEGSQPAAANWPPDGIDVAPASPQAPTNAATLDREGFNPSLDGLITPVFPRIGRQLLGRRPSFVFLLHATRLNADSIDQLTAILHRNDLRAITLNRAMKDRSYRIADNYAGPDGDEWLSRWSRTLHKDLPWSSFPEPPVDIAAENDRLDTEP